MKKMRIFWLACTAVMCLLVVPGFSEPLRTEDRSPDKRGQDNFIETVAETEKRVKKLVNSGVKFALPYLMTAVTEIQLSSSCLRGLLKLMRGVMDIKDWAIKMVDALGKPSAGILEGTPTAMGDYDECLDIMVPKNRISSVPPYTQKELDFQGQYCVVQINIPEGLRQAAMAYQAGNRSHSELANSKTFLRNLIKLAPRADVADFRLGVCLPSICDKNDLQQIVDQVSRMVMIKATALRCEVSKPKPLATEQILVLAGIGLVALCVMVGTAVEMILRRNRTDPIDDTFYEKKNLLLQCILAFSAIKNIQKLFTLKPSDPPKVSCIRGIKFLSVCLYVIMWTYATPQDFHFLKYRSAFHMHKFMEQWWFSVLANAAAGVDTLFLIPGLVLTYKLWSNSNGGKVKISIPKFILKWYIRFTLAQFMMIGLFLCLPLIGNGPIWDDVVTPNINNCKERWWLNALALNNFWSSSDVCLPHTWLICAMMHMLFLAPVILLILSKWTALGVFVNLIIIMGSSVAIAMVTFMKDLPPAPAYYFLSFINLKAIWDKLFIQAYDHISAFCIGILLGYVFHRYPTFKLKKTTVILGWISAAACNMAVMCGLYGYHNGESMEITLSAIYASVHRIGWSLGMSWVIFACAYGYGGFLNSILSWKFFIPMERMSALIFLLHPLILFLHEGQLRERMYMAHLDQVMYATAYIVFTVAISIVCYISCFAPYMFFEKLIWSFLSKLKTDKDVSEKKCPVKENKSTIVEQSLEKEKLKHISQSVVINEKEKNVLKT